MTKKVKYLSLAGIIAVLCAAIALYCTLTPKKISYIPIDDIPTWEDKPFLLMVHDSPIGEFMFTAHIPLINKSKICNLKGNINILVIGLQPIGTSGDDFTLEIVDCGRRRPIEQISISKLKDREILARGQFWYLQVIK